MDRDITIQELLDRIHESRSEWERVISEVPGKRMLEPGVCLHWSLKDLIAHMTWYEREMVNTLKNRRLSGSVLWRNRVGERNAAIYEENRNRSLEDVLEESTDVYTGLINLLKELEQEDLHNPGSFSGMPPEWEPWEMFAENTYEHYEYHAAQVRAWLKG